CKVCGEASIGYVQVFLRNRKTDSFPVCTKHYAIACVFKEFGQDAVRSFLAEVCPIKKGSIPRLKTSLRP
ncbi:MAG: hypothetical protein JSV90_00785, partial [Methanobacteriota archaeon]